MSDLPHGGREMRNPARFVRCPVCFTVFPMYYIENPKSYAGRSMYYVEFLMSFTEKTVSDAVSSTTGSGGPEFDA